eukprot:m.14854 g.14854  ORF g.14854 m.14854 type:complete len:224 (+) comp4911_c0_seq1:528-1199(+)
MSDTKCKVVCLGAPRSGKTALVSQFAFCSYDSHYTGTVGVDFASKTVFLPSGDRVRLQLWDTSGDERFRTLTPWYIREAAASLIVYDITDRASFDAVGKWMKFVRAEHSSNTLVFLVGTRTDQAHKRVVSTDEGRRKAAELGAGHAECCCSDHDSVVEVFATVARMAKEQADATVITDEWTEISIGDCEAGEAAPPDCMTMTLELIKRMFKIVGTVIPGAQQQ